MLVQAHLDRAIQDERSETLCPFQRFQLRDGPDLTAVFQPDSQLAAPTYSYNITVHQRTVVRAWARISL
jgi:hypothetical protein